VSSAKQKKTAYFTHFLTSKALQQPVEAADAVLSSSREQSRALKKRVHHQQPTTSSDSSIRTAKSEQLPPIHRHLRQHSINDFASKRAAHLLLKYNKSPQPSKLIRNKTMSMTTTAKKPMPNRANDVLPQSVRSHSSDSNKRVRTINIRRFLKTKKQTIELFRLANSGGHRREMKSKFVRNMIMHTKMPQPKSIL